jgi:hypothetical protein
MPPTDDCDPVQDLKTAREGEAQPPAPTLGDLYRGWAAAHAEWADAAAELKAVQQRADLARAKAVRLEQKLAAAALADVPREMGRSRSAWVVMAGGLYHVDETGCEADGWRYELRPVPVRKLAV